MQRLLKARTGRKLIALVVGVACLWILGACSQWPPYAEELSENYFDNREEIMALSMLVMQSPYTQLFHSNKSGGVRVAEDQRGAKSIEFVEGASENSINELFTMLGLSAAIKLGNELQLEVPGVRFRGITFYVYYLHGRSADGAPTCSQSRRSNPRGMCRMPLDEDWSIVYKW